MRAPRKNFATPFVLTIAAASSGGACHHHPIHDNPAPPKLAPIDAGIGPDSAMPTANPPAPNDPSLIQEPAPPPPKPPPVIHRNPPPSQPAMSWVVQRSGDRCTAQLDYVCPGPIGKAPAPTCNPPGRRDYKCPSFLADNESIRVTRPANASKCFVDEHITCKPGATCNPPPPRELPCPEP